jgi:hypothetical protein
LRKTGSKKDAAKPAAKAKAAAGTDADGSTLFPLPNTPLGDAARKFAAIKEEIAERKARCNEVEEQVLDEMEKDGRERLIVTAGSDNYEFTIKTSRKRVRCVKLTRQPLPKPGAQVSEE